MEAANNRPGLIGGLCSLLRTTLCQNSLLNREITGNFADFSFHGADRRPKKADLLELFAQIPYATEQGIFESRTGNSLSGSGNFQGGSGKHIS
jgi:hypothetical protein